VRFLANIGQAHGQRRPAAALLFAPACDRLSPIAENTVNVIEVNQSAWLIHRLHGYRLWPR
jgi:hypothetical protein